MVGVIAKALIEIRNPPSAQCWWAEESVRPGIVRLSTRILLKLLVLASRFSHLSLGAECMAMGLVGGFKGTVVYRSSPSTGIDKMDYSVHSFVEIYWEL